MQSFYSFQEHSIRASIPGSKSLARRHRCTTTTGPANFHGQLFFLRLGLGPDRRVDLNDMIPHASNSISSSNFDAR